MWSVTSATGASRTPSGHETEAFAVGGGADADAAMEGAAQHFGTGEAARAGDGLQRLGAILQERAGTLDAQRLDVGAGCLADLDAEGTGERALAEVRSGRQRGHRQILVEMAGDPSLQLAQHQERRHL